MKPDINFNSDFTQISATTDGRFVSGKSGVNRIFQTRDKKIEFVDFEDQILAVVNSALGYPAYYPVNPVKIEKPVKAVLMDLDGTSVHSEEFWIWIIQLSIASVLGNPKFELKESDIPFVSGHSVSEHLQYCITKYCPEKSVEEAREYYFQHVKREMQKIIEGKGRKDAFIPTRGLKEFLLELKRRKIKIGLVTSGLYQKAYPEILSAFQTLDMGDPAKFYDAIITAGFPLIKGKAGTMGELSPKPHPWLYAETCRIGLGIPFRERSQVIGIEDSAAGIYSIRLAGFSAIGISGGNILESGSKPLCNHYCNNFDEILRII